jgi:hypothetical protein
MLRSKKYNLYKHKGLNYLFDICTTEYNDCILIEDYMNDIIIKKNDNYELIKETILEPYILKLNNILLIHIRDDFIKDFEFLYKKSNKYTFDIYETSYQDLKEDTYIKIYHVFCVSKKLTKDINYESFLRANDSDKKYVCLSLFYGPNLIVNRRFDVTSEQDKFQAKYKFVKSIGKGIVDNSIRSFIKIMINLVNSYQDMLPPHYLKIN